MADVGRLLCEVFTDTELSLLVDSVHQVHAPESDFRAWAPCADSVIHKLGLATEVVAARKRKNVELVASLSDEERDFILDHRNRVK